MCLAQGHSVMTPVRLEPATTRSRVKDSTTEPLRSLIRCCVHLRYGFKDGPQNDRYMDTFYYLFSTCPQSITFIKHLYKYGCIQSSLHYFHQYFGNKVNMSFICWVYQHGQSSDIFSLVSKDSTFCQLLKIW